MVHEGMKGEGCFAGAASAFGNDQWGFRKRLCEREQLGRLLKDFV